MATSAGVLPRLWWLLMSFASWKKCDFQIHTPRDPNWTGARPVGLGESITTTDAKATTQDVDVARAQWAKEFVDQCVAKGLQAVALTDHHEMIMVPYVQKEIEQRRKAVPDFDLWLFPGMELTASGGKQCLIIFDADLSEDWRKQAQGKLGIAFAALEEKGAVAPKVTQLACAYPEIARLLDEVEHLRGRYIVLPNVSQGNSHTVLTDGSHGDFRRMPYVGGYLDRGQTINTLGAKNRTRLSGTDKTWSTREIYPLPTSDSRSADYGALGTNDTWIKLAEPTAEAIRQAFLGHRSRIRIEPPAIPSLVAATIEAEGSTILQPTSITLSPEFNAVIGGRGSGKSSFLEYLAFGLGRSCYDAPREHYSGTHRMHDLINDTLVSKGGQVSLTVIQDNAPFKIVRGPATTYQPRITYPNGSTQTITVKELRALFPAVVYSQGELAENWQAGGPENRLSDCSSSSIRISRRRMTGWPPISKPQRERSGRRSSCQALAGAVETPQPNDDGDSLRQRVEALEKTLPTLSPDDQAKVDHFDKANDFESKRFQASKHADQILQELEVSAAELSTSAIFQRTSRERWKPFSKAIATCSRLSAPA